MLEGHVRNDSFFITLKKVIIEKTLLFLDLDSCKLFYNIPHDQRIPNMCLCYEIGNWVKECDIALSLTNKQTNTDLYYIDGSQIMVHSCKLIDSYRQIYM